VNRLLLSGEGTFFLTMRQVNEMGGRVKKGSRGYPVIYMAPYLKKDNAKAGNEPEEEAEERNTSAAEKRTMGTVMRYYTVFKVDDVEGIEAPEFPEVGARPEAEDIVKGYPNPPTIFHKGSQPCYIRSIDAIEMPDRNYFRDSDSYYGTLFHELGHSTGAAHRLNREEMSHSLGFGSTNYAKEELIAELTSAFLCQECGIEKRIDNQAAYIQNWLEVLRNDKKIVVNAASQAERATEHVMGKSIPTTVPHHI
jgi:antirestriction protein ArdC